jgi:hypothetical protein
MMSSDRITEPGETPRDAPTLSDPRGEVRVSRHAIHRWRERQPHGCPVSLQEAWRRGERLKHDNVARGDGHESVAEARIYRHGDNWAVVFLVNSRLESRVWGSQDKRVLLTVTRVRDYDHGPTRTYLDAYGPHDR